jgi:GTP pyrophosphokinase
VKTRWLNTDAVASILDGIGSRSDTGGHLSGPRLPTLDQARGSYLKAFGEITHAGDQTTKLVNVQRQARAASNKRLSAGGRCCSTDGNRSQNAVGVFTDLRVVMMRPGVHRNAAAMHGWPTNSTSLSFGVWSAPCDFAPLANRRYLADQMEMEDLAFRFLGLRDFKQTARLLDEKRSKRERSSWYCACSWKKILESEWRGGAGAGRPKHLQHR